MTLAEMTLDENAADIKMIVNEVTVNALTFRT